MRRTLWMLVMFACLSVGAVHSQTGSEPMSNAPQSDAPKSDVRDGGGVSNDESKNGDSAGKKAKRAKHHKQKSTTKEPDQQPPLDCWVNRTCVDP
jgi:hypothetical protein